jgi:hypothetical protein
VIAGIHPAEGDYPQGREANDASVFPISFKVFIRGQGMKRGKKFRWKKLIILFFPAAATAFLLWYALYGKNMGVIEYSPIPFTNYLPPGETLFVGSAGPKTIGPMQSYWGLYLSSGRGIFKRNLKINGPESLVGRVHITNPEMALRYAQLFTRYLPDPEILSPGTGWGEVVPGRMFDEDYIINHGKVIMPASRKDTKQPEKRKSGDNNRAAGERPVDEISFLIGELSINGMLNPDFWMRNKLPLPVLKKAGDDYIVQRILFRVPQGRETETNDIYWVEERISPEGELIRKILRKLCLKEKITIHVSKDENRKSGKGSGWEDPAAVHF